MASTGDEDKPSFARFEELLEVDLFDGDMEGLRSLITLSCLEF